MVGMALSSPLNKLPGGRETSELAVIFSLPCPELVGTLIFLQDTPGRLALSRAGSPRRRRLFFLVGDPDTGFRLRAYCLPWLQGKQPGTVLRG